MRERERERAVCVYKPCHEVVGGCRRRDRQGRLRPRRRRTWLPPPNAAAVAGSFRRHPSLACRRLRRREARRRNPSAT